MIGDFLSGIAGAVIGAGASFGVTWMTLRGKREEQKTSARYEFIKSVNKTMEEDRTKLLQILAPLSDFRKLTKGVLLTVLNELVAWVYGGGSHKDSYDLVHLEILPLKILLDETSSKMTNDDPLEGEDNKKKIYELRDNLMKKMDDYRRYTIELADNHVLT